LTIEWGNRGSRLALALGGLPCRSIHLSDEHGQDEEGEDADSDEGKRKPNTHQPKENKQTASLKK